MKPALASLVWDGGDDVVVPSTLGEPTPKQLTGSAGEQLIELATRVCYDSLGVYPPRHPKAGKPRGRSTAKTLKNVLDVKHLSVLEHYVRTVFFDTTQDITHVCANRPGVFVRRASHLGGWCGWRVTLNVRSVIEWDRWSDTLGRENAFSQVPGETPISGYPSKLARAVGSALRYCFSQAVPLLVSPTQVDGILVGELIEPETDAERWITLYLVGSRGFSHEMVRHRFAMSQRSTRYCAEDNSPWHWHPLLQRATLSAEFRGLLVETEASCKASYSLIVFALEAWLLKTLPPETPYRAKHALKQARGAARGFLGNALETQMFFSGPVWAWRHIANMRAAEAADAEIRVVIAEAVRELKRSRYADRFDDLTLIEAQDGMGLCIDGGGHA